MPVRVDKRLADMATGKQPAECYTWNSTGHLPEQGFVSSLWVWVNWHNANNDASPDLPQELFSRLGGGNLTSVRSPEAVWDHSQRAYLTPEAAEEALAAATLADEEA